MKIVTIPQFLFNKDRLDDTPFKLYVSNPDAKPYAFLDFKVSKFNEYVELGAFLGERPELATTSNGERLLDIMYNAKANWGENSPMLTGSQFENVLIRYDAGSGKASNDIAICNRDIFYQTYNVDKETGLCKKMGAVYGLECPQEKTPPNFVTCLLDGREIENVSICSDDFIKMLKQAIGEENVKVHHNIYGENLVEIFTLESANKQGEFLSPDKTITIGLKGEAWLQKTTKFNKSYVEATKDMEIIEKDFSNTAQEVQQKFEDEFYDEHGFSLDSYFEANGDEAKAIEIEKQKLEQEDSHESIDNNTDSAD